MSIKTAREEVAFVLALPLKQLNAESRSLLHKFRGSPLFSKSEKREIRKKLRDYQRMARRKRVKARPKARKLVVA